MALVCSIIFNFVIAKRLSMVLDCLLRPIRRNRTVRTVQSELSMSIITVAHLFRHELWKLSTHFLALTVFRPLGAPDCSKQKLSGHFLTQRLFVSLGPHNRQRHRTRSMRKWRFIRKGKQATPSLPPPWIIHLLYLYRHVQTESKLSI